MMLALPIIIDELENERKRNVDGQIGFFDLLSAGPEDNESINKEFIVDPAEDFSTSEKLKAEKEVTGLYLSGHPMAEYAEIAESIKSDTIGSLINSSEVKDNSRVRVLCQLASVRKKLTAKNNAVAYITAEDITGSMEIIAFSNIIAAYSSILTEGEIVLVHGRLSLKEDEAPKIIAELIEPCPPKQEKTPEKKKQRKGLFLRFDSENSPQIKECEKLLAIFDGRVPLYYYFTDKNEYKVFGNENGIAVNDVLLRELRRILGESNVIFNE